MKKLSFVMILAITGIAFSGCAKLTENLTVKVPVEATIELDIPAGGDLKSGGGRIFSTSEVYNTATDPTVLEYKEKIKDIAANGGKIKLSLTPPVTSLNLSNTVLQVRNVDTGELLIRWDFEAKTYEGDVELTLGTPAEGGFESFSSALDEGANLIVEFTGNSGDYAAGWKLHFIISMSITTQIF
jgi:hypothetical protein